MTALNSLQKALVDNGLAERPKERKPKQGKPVVCRKCGKPMKKMTDANIAYCEECNSSFIVFNR